MINLDYLAKKLQVVLGESATAELMWTLSAYDNGFPVNFRGLTNDTTPVIMCEGIQGNPAQIAVYGGRRVETISVFNCDSISHQVIVSENDGTATGTIVSATIDVGFSLHYDSDGWYVLDRTGARTSTVVNINSIAIGAVVSGGTPKHLLFTNASGDLDNCILMQESDGITIPQGKFIRSSTIGKGQIELEDSNGAVVITTDQGGGAESKFQMNNISAGIIAPNGNFEVNPTHTRVKHDNLIVIDATTIHSTTDGGIGVTALLKLSSNPLEPYEISLSSPSGSISNDVVHLNLIHIAEVSLGTPVFNVNGADVVQVNNMQMDGLFEITALNPNAVLYLDATKIVRSSAVTPTELSYLSGVTSAIQTQLNAKEPSITASTTAKYYRGDKTFQALDTLAVPENTNLYFTNARALSAAPAETVTTTGALINGATDKPIPVDADYVGLMDSAAANILKKLSWLNIKATLKTYFDTVYQAALVSGTNIKTVNGSMLLGSGNLAVGDELVANKDTANGYVGINAWKINFRNLANTFTSFLTNAATAARTWVFPDYDGTVSIFSRETMGDANKTFSTGKTIVSLTTALTASRVLTFPPANSFPAGTPIFFIDNIQTITFSNTVTATRAGADLINGLSTYVINYGGGISEFSTDGVSRWTGGTISTSNDGAARTDWNPTIAGFSVLPTGQTARYANTGKLYKLTFFCTGDGTVNATSVTFSLPAPSLMTCVAEAVRLTHNGVIQMGYISLTAGSSIANVLPTVTGGPWTNGPGRFPANFTYFAQ